MYGAGSDDHLAGPLEHPAAARHLRVGGGSAGRHVFKAEDHALLHSEQPLLHHALQGTDGAVKSGLMHTRQHRVLA